MLPYPEFHTVYSEVDALVDNSQKPSKLVTIRSLTIEFYKRSNEDTPYAFCMFKRNY